MLLFVLYKYSFQKTDFKDANRRKERLRKRFVLISAFLPLYRFQVKLDTIAFIRRRR